MKSVAILGAGKLGTVLGRALSQSGFRVEAVSCRRLVSAQESAALIGKSTLAFSDNLEASYRGKWIALTPPDDEIAAVVKELSPLDLRGRLVFHCSGILTADVLAPLEKKGALTASAHPVQTFASRRDGPELFRGIHITLEGEDKARSRLKEMANKIGGNPLEIHKEDKPVYHAACSLSSNLLIALLQTASDLIKPLEIKKEKKYQILLPLVRQTLNNIEEKGLLESLTGPVIRGDLQTVKIHLAALRKNPPAYRLYRNLAGRVLEAAAREIPPDKYQILMSWLADK
ncbi:MAG: Rossmann-like and DUF2520 domain-containing protein [Candidatus Aminicenantes bacterium]